MITTQEPTGATIHRVLVPFAGQWLTSNQDRYRYDRAAEVRAWRASVQSACLYAHLPRGISPVKIHAFCYYVGRRPVDDSLNLAPTIKALVDGLTPTKVITRRVKGGVRRYVTCGYGLLPDDSDKHIVGLPTWDVLASPTGQPFVVLQITEATHAPASPVAPCPVEWGRCGVRKPPATAHACGLLFEHVRHQCGCGTVGAEGGRPWLS